MTQDTEHIDQPRTQKFPTALLEPLAWWDRVEYFDANDLDEIIEEIACQLGQDDRDFEPEAAYRRFDFHGSVGQFGVYVHKSGELLAPGFVAIVLTAAPEPYIDYGPYFGPDDDPDDDPVDDHADESVRAFARLAGVFGLGPTADAAAYEVIQHLPYGYRAASRAPKSS